MEPLFLIALIITAGTDRIENIQGSFHETAKAGKLLFISLKINIHLFV
jgi:hypothetical protein